MYGYQQRKGYTGFFVHYLFFGTSKIVLDKYIMAIYLSLGKYKTFLFPHPMNVAFPGLLIHIKQSRISITYFSKANIHIKQAGISTAPLSTKFTNMSPLNVGVLNNIPK